VPEPTALLILNTGITLGQVKEICLYQLRAQLAAYSTCSLVKPKQNSFRGEVKGVSYRDVYRAFTSATNILLSLDVHCGCPSVGVHRSGLLTGRCRGRTRDLCTGGIQIFGYSGRQQKYLMYVYMYVAHIPT
jgi:hypothetical protein